MATAALPQDPDLDQLRNQARELQRAVRSGEPAALTRVSRWHPDAPPASRRPGEEPLADRFLRLAWLTSRDDQAAGRVAAAQLLAQHPELPARSLFAAAACADAAQVRRHLAGRPGQASLIGGPCLPPSPCSPAFSATASSPSDIPGNEPWHTALHVAAETGNLTLARTLLTLGADPNIPDQHYQSTPLGWARHFGQPALAELLEPRTRPT